MSKPNMIKRADGSYSQRGLWDNIRANKGSGKAPTKEMLKQEKKIKAKYEDGGTTGKNNKIKLNTNIITNKQDNTVNNSPQLRQKNQNWVNQSLTNGSFNPNKMYAKGNVEEATLDAMAALDLPFALGKGLVRGITSGAIKNSLRELGNQYAPNLYKTEQLANIKKGEEFFTNWMNNPNTIKRLKSNDLEKRVLNNRYGNSNIPSRGTKLQDMNNTVNNGESLVYFSPYKDMYKELHGKEMPFSHKIEPGFRTLQGFNDPNLIKPIVGNNVKLNKTAGTTVHELTHRYAQPDYGPTSRMFDDMEHGFSTPSHFTEHQKYLSQGNEVHARVMELRQHYKMDPNNHYVNDQMLDNIIKDGLAGKTPIQSDFFKIAKNNRGKLKNAFNYAPVAAGVAGITNETMKTNKYNNGGTIHIKPENKGKFNATKKATGKTTEELTHSKNPVTKKRAIFAQNAAKWKHAEGGEIDPKNTFGLTGNYSRTPNPEAIESNYKLAADYQRRLGNFNAGLNANLGFDHNLPLNTEQFNGSPTIIPNANLGLNVDYDRNNNNFSGSFNYNPINQGINAEVTYKKRFADGGRVLPKYAEAGWLTKNKAGVGAGLGFAGDTTNLLFDNNVFGTRNEVTDSEGNVLGEAQSDAGSQTQGALSGALKGASSLAALGPWGMAGGALIGGTVGFLTADTGAEDKLNQIKRERNAQISFKNMLGKGPIENNSIQTNSLALSAYGGYINKKYAEGGMKVISRNHPNPQEEVEGGETAITPSGKNIQFKGPKHNNGGIKTNLPSGTRIFSDRIIYPG